jgi:hypothetical protein
MRAAAVLSRCALLAVLLALSRAAWAAGFIFGVCTHLGQDVGDESRLVHAVVDLGANAIRDDVYWHRVEKARGERNVAKGVARLQKAIGMLPRNVKPLVILGYGNQFYDGGDLPRTDEAQDQFAGYVEAVARALGDRVEMYEVWNEWNIGAGRKAGERYGEPRTYVSLLRRAYVRVKQVKPDAVVLAGAVAGWDFKWIEAFLREGGLRYLDGFSIHPYVFGNGDRNHPEVLEERMVRLRQLLDKHSGGKEVPVYFTEIGWPNHSGPEGTNPERVADYAVRLMLLVATMPDVKGVWWYDLLDDGDSPDNKEHNFGLLRRNYQPKPAYGALKRVTTLLAGARRVERLPSPRGTFGLRLEMETGKQAMVFWSYDRSAPTRSVTLRAASNPAVERLASGESVPVEQSARGVRMVLTESPLVVRGGLSMASLAW